MRIRPLLSAAAAVLAAACGTSSDDPAVDARADRVDAQPVDAADRVPDAREHDAREYDAREYDAHEYDARQPAPDAIEVIDESTAAGVHLARPHLVEYSDAFGTRQTWFAELHNDGAGRFCAGAAIVKFLDANDAPLAYPGAGDVAPRSFAGLDFPGECIESGGWGYVFTRSIGTTERLPIAKVKVHYVGFFETSVPANPMPQLEAALQDDQSVDGTVRASFNLPAFRVVVIGIDADGLAYSQDSAERFSPLPAGTTWSFSTNRLRPETIAPATVYQFLQPR